MSEQGDVIKELRDDITGMAIKCWNCNFCFSTCPVVKSTRGFYSAGPSGLIQSLYYALRWRLLDGPDKDELLKLIYRCTTCNACVNTCKKISSGVPILDIIERGRRLLVEEGVGPMPEQRKPLESIYMYGNPYSEAPEKRLDWLRDLRVKRLPHEKADVLYFVGCTASHEPELHNVARSLVKLFHLLKINFGVLEEERCCGEPALRIGDKVLFEEVARQNIEAFTECGVNTIVTTSPHCLNVFAKDYQGLRDAFQLKHYTELLAEKLSDSRAAFRNEVPYTVTYHDPCFLSKHNNILDSPRKLLTAIPKLKLVEMKMHGMDSLCCGGGGGRMFTEVEEEEKLSNMRVRQALEVGADIIATACPWCYTMLRDSVKGLRVDNKIRVMDVAVIVAEALGL